MAKKPPPDSFTDKGSARQNSVMGGQFEQWLAFTGQVPGAARRSTYRLPASGAMVIQPTIPTVVMDWAVGASSGQLTGIDGSQLPDGAQVRVRLADPSRPITLKDSVSSVSQSSRLLLGADLALVATAQTVDFEDTGAGWQPANIFFGNALSAFRAYYGISAGGSAPVATAAQAVAGADDAAMMTALKVRDALVSPTWLAALPVLLPANVRDIDALLYYDGLNLYRVAKSSLFQGVPTKGNSVDLTLYTGGFAEAAHGLSATPSLVTTTLVCNTSDAGFSAGQQATSFDVNPYCSSSKVGYTAANTIGLNDGGGGYRSVTPSKWTVRVRFWL